MEIEKVYEKYKHFSVLIHDIKKTQDEVDVKEGCCECIINHIMCDCFIAIEEKLNSSNRCKDIKVKEK